MRLEAASVPVCRADSSARECSELHEPTLSRMKIGVYHTHIRCFRFSLSELPRIASIEHPLTESRAIVSTLAGFQGEKFLPR